MNFKTNLQLKSRIIDPAPLIDVMFLVMMFFVLATQFRGQPGLVVDLPSAGTAAIYKGEMVVVSLTATGMVFQNKDVSRDNLKQELSKLKAEEGKPVLVIKADKDVSHTRIVEIIDSAQGVGIRRIAIATKEQTR